MRTVTRSNFIKITVKLGYNDHGYNKYTVITNKMSSLVWFSMVYQNNFMVITNEFSELHGYNEQICINHSLITKNYAFN